MVEYKGEHMAMLQARKLIAGYFKGMRGAAELRNQSGKVCTLNDLYTLKIRLYHLFMMLKLIYFRLRRIIMSEKQILQLLIISTAMILLLARQ